MYFRSEDGSTVDLGESPLTDDEISRITAAVANRKASLHQVAISLSSAMATIDEERRLLAIGRDFFGRVSRLPLVKVENHPDPLVDQWGWMTREQQLEYGRAATRLMRGE